MGERLCVPFEICNYLPYLLFLSLAWHELATYIIFNGISGESELISLFFFSCMRVTYESALR